MASGMGMDIGISSEMAMRMVIPSQAKDGYVYDEGSDNDSQHEHAENIAMGKLMDMEVCKDATYVRAL